MKTKEKLIFEAFKLFCTKPYSQVTFADLEGVTNLSRGAILYHFKSKEDIFIEVIDNHVLNENSLVSIKKENRGNLKNFISHFVTRVKKEKLKMKKLGLQNMNLALLNIETSAYNFYPNMTEKAIEWNKNESKIWEEVISNAVEKKEIKGNINTGQVAKLFNKIYMGDSFLSVMNPEGIIVEDLQEDLMLLYKFLLA